MQSVEDAAGQSRSMRISMKTIYVHYPGKRELPDNRAKVETLVRFVISSARAHVNETTEDEWMQNCEIAADAFSKANGDLIREFVSAGMSADPLGAIP